MIWAGILAFVTGMVDQELLARIEYLAAENRILKAQSKGRLKLSDAERATLGEIGHRLGRKVLAEVANVARPDTILAWYRKLVAHKVDGSKVRRNPGRPRIKQEIERLIVRMAKENRDWGFDRIAGALANLGYEVCDQTVGNVLQRRGLRPAPERKRTTTWPDFIRTHLALLAGTDFFTAEVLTLRGLITYYVLFFIHLESRRVDIAGITVQPDEAWMQQIARNVTMEGCGSLRDCRYLLHDRDSKYTQSFRAIIASGQVEPLVGCRLDFRLPLGSSASVPGSNAPVDWISLFAGLSVQRFIPCFSFCLLDLILSHSHSDLMFDGYCRSKLGFSSKPGCWPLLWPSTQVEEGRSCPRLLWSSSQGGSGFCDCSIE